VPAAISDGNLHLLSEAELRAVRRTHRLAVSAAAGLSVVGFVAYFLPVYLAPELFPTTTLTFRGDEYPLPLVETLWGLVLMVLEIYALVLLNVWGVHGIAAASGLLRPHNKDEVAGTLLDIGLENKHRGLLDYGIDPYLGMSRGLLFTINLVLRLKGWLGSKILRYAVQRLLGRFAVREVLDFVGMPIYMAINAWSTHSVLHEAKVIIMGQKLIEELCVRLPPDLVPGPADKALLYDTLRFIAVSKRDFHRNHYTLTRALIERYGIKVETGKGSLDDYLARLAGADETLRRAAVLLIVLGFVLDGQLSWRERRRIGVLAERGVFAFTGNEVATMCRDFVRGAGVEGLLARQLAHA
jgi:hypothetical protein